MTPTAYIIGAAWMALSVMVLVSGCSPAGPEETADPALLSVYPADGAMAVPSDTTIIVYYSEPMDTATCEARFYAYHGDGSGMGHMMMHNQQEMTGSFMWNEDHTEMTFHPDSSFMDSTMVTFHLEEGMEAHQSSRHLMMAGMSSWGMATDDGIFCTFTTK